MILSGKRTKVSVSRGWERPRSFVHRDEPEPGSHTIPVIMCHMDRHIERRKKQPRTFSLSEDVIAAVEAYKRDRRIATLTAALEEIVREWKRVRLAQEVTAYYDSLSDAETREQEQWGSFSESEM